MMVTYERPTIVDEADKPIPLENQSYPYGSILSDRRFEELIYSIYRLKINHDGSWRALYDDIALMQGVGEKGRDCILYKEGKNNGAIQCKKYNTRITKPDCAKEIIKFVLYSMVDANVLPDERDFTYYFVAASGFSEPAAEFLDQLRFKIEQEKEFEDWTRTVINSYVTFRGIDYSSIKSKLLGKLKAIKVFKIIPQTLDLELSNTYSKIIVALFFAARTITDNRSIDELNSTLKGYIQKDELSINEEAIQEKFAIASLQLSNYRNYLYNISETHIDRKETVEILTWLKSPLTPKSHPILVLLGNPGYGKSVIMRDVYQALITEGIPVIGIKCDRYYVDSITALSEKMNLEYSPISLIQKLLKTHQCVTVLIDQIDSLSQSVTTKRDYIDTYNKLLIELGKISGVRVVISIRIFDLTYDYELSMYKGFDKIEVKPLDLNSIKNALSKFRIPNESLSPALIELLSIPNHLDIFCKIYNQNLSIGNFYTLQDLYHELWKQKIETSESVKSDQDRKAVFEIAKRLNASQTLSIPLLSLSVDIQTRIGFLISNGLLTQQGSEIQFFHQSFYDYVFARAFVEEGNAVMQFVLDQQQSIYLRPALKMILTFLRQKNDKSYIDTIRRLIIDKAVRFHLKLLVLNQIGFESNPTVGEIQLVCNNILTETQYFVPFLESVTGKGWFMILQSNNTLSDLLSPKIRWIERLNQTRLFKTGFMINVLLKFNLTLDYERRKVNQMEVWYHLIRRALIDQRNNALKYLVSLNETENKDFIILRLLHSLKIWDNPLAFELYDRNVYQGSKYWYHGLRLLEDAINYNFEWVLNHFRKFYYEIPDSSELPQGSTLSHQKIELIELLFKTNVEKAFDFSIETIHEIIKRRLLECQLSIDSSAFYVDDIFSFFDFNRAHVSNAKDALYQQAVDAIKILAQRESDVFSKFIKEMENENSISLIKIALIGLESAPIIYSQKSFEFLLTVHHKEGFNESALQYYIRNLISKVYTYLKIEQKDTLNNIILNLKQDKEYSVMHINGKKVYDTYFGYLSYQYLCSIPAKERERFPEIKQKFGEYYRKYNQADNVEPLKITSHLIGPPLKERAYDNMPLDQWHNSFLKYDKERGHSFDSDRGGLFENQRKFSEKVKENPMYFLPLIERILDDDRIAHDYVISGLTGLKDCGFSPEGFFKLYKRAIRMSLKDFNLRQLVWLSEYLSINKLIDEEIFEFLCAIALHDPNPIKDLNPNNPEHDSLNTNRGAAVHSIVTCYYNASFTDKIFSTLSEVSKDPILSVRIAALTNLAVLLNINKERTLGLFLSFTSISENEHVYNSSLRTAQYLARYNFDALIPFFKNAIKIDRVQKNIATILSVCWINGEEQSYELLEDLSQKSEKAKAAMIGVALVNLLDKNTNVQKKCVQLYKRFLNNNHKETIHEFSTFFLRLDASLFKNYLFFLKDYSRSNAVKKDPHYYYDYLLKCSKNYSVECLGLISPYSQYDIPNHFEGPYYDGSEPIKIVIGAYNGLYEKIPLDLSYINEALNLFDNMLKQSVFRLAANEVLNTI